MGFPNFRHSLTQLRLEHVGIHLGHHLALGDVIPFIDEFFRYPAGIFGGDIDFGGLNASIGAGDVLCFVGLEVLPACQATTATTAMIPITQAAFFHRALLWSAI